MSKRLELEEALALLLGELNKTEDTEKVFLSGAYGRILADDIRAPFSVPSFPKAAMDGYAVRAAEVESAAGDAPVELVVVGEQLAGEMLKKNENSNVVVGMSNTAVRIMTGARVPEGYDAVVRQEDTDYGETAVKIYKGVKPFTNYCKVGEDIREGETVLKAGARIGRIEAGVLASLGIASLDVVRKLKVDIISTGTELKRPGEPLGEYDIYNSIAYTLSASLSSTCFEAESFICGDEGEDIEKTLLTSLRERKADIIITTGGVSVGKKDLLPEVLEKIGAKHIFDHVNVKPGTPTIGSVIDGVPILSLSGNPYAALANFDFYFPSIAAKLTGSDTFLTGVEKAVFNGNYDKVSPVRRLLRAGVKDGRVSLPGGGHASSVLSNLMDCNAYIDVPAGVTLSAGDEVIIRLMP